MIELKDILKKVATAKGVTAILIIVFIGIFVWKNLDFLTEVQFTLKKLDKKTETQKSELEKKASGVPQLAFGEIVLSPASKKLPSIVVFRIDNPGSAVTKAIRIVINFGPTKVIEYEVIGPKEEDVTGSNAGQSVINLDINELRPHESTYIYALTSYPSFDKIAISSNDTTSVIEYTYKDYLAKKQPEASPNFFTFLKFLFGAFIVVMVIYFTGVMIIIINNWLKKKFNF